MRCRCKRWYREGAENEQEHGIEAALKSRRGRCRRYLDELGHQFVHWHSHTCSPMCVHTGPSKRSTQSDPMNIVPYNPIPPHPPSNEKPQPSKEQDVFEEMKDRV